MAKFELRALAGILERERKGADRVRILIQILSYRVHVEIERDMVKKIREAGSHT